MGMQVNTFYWVAGPITECGNDSQKMTVRSTFTSCFCLLFIFDVVVIKFLVFQKNDCSSKEWKWQGDGLRLNRSEILKIPNSSRLLIWSLTGRWGLWSHCVWCNWKLSSTILLISGLYSAGSPQPGSDPREQGLSCPPPPGGQLPDPQGSESLLMHSDVRSARAQAIWEIRNDEKWTVWTILAMPADTQFVFLGLAFALRLLKS